MPSCFFYEGIIKEYIILDKSETLHIKSLKSKESEIIHIVNGKGELYQGLLQIESNQAKVKLTSLSPILKTEKSDYQLCIAPTKNINRIEWLIEKCTEIGVHNIIFFFKIRNDTKLNWKD